MMKKTGLIVLIVSLLCCMPAKAQFGGLINMGKNAVKKTKEKVENVAKVAKGDIDIIFEGQHQGVYKSKQGVFVMDALHEDGEFIGKNITVTIEENGDLIYDDGSKIGELLKGGIINCRKFSPYCTLADNGDVVMDGEVIGHIDDNGNVTMEGSLLGNVKGIDKQVAAYIYFGALQNKELIAKNRLNFRAEKQKAEERRKKAEEARKNREWTIEKNGSKGYVKGNGEVYNWSHTKIGQLPQNGDGNIEDGQGNIIGRIRLGHIYDKMGQELADVNHNTGDTSIPGNSNQMVIVRSGNVILQEKDQMMGFKDVKTLGSCNVQPYEWAVAIIYCNFFRF